MSLGEFGQRTLTGRTTFLLWLCSRLLLLLLLLTFPDVPTALERDVNGAAADVIAERWWCWCSTDGRTVVGRFAFFAT